MNRLVKPGRLAVMALVTLAILTIFMVTLYNLQIIQGNAYYNESRNNIVTTTRVAAARGSIMDRYGRVLVENRNCNNLLIDSDSLFGDRSAEAIAKANATILTLVNTIRDYGDTYTDTLPITKTPPFEYTSMSDIQRATLSAWMKEKKLDDTATAVEVMAYMRDRFSIDNSYTAEETRIIAGVRYEINARWIDGFTTSDYIFAQDVSMDLITELMENDVPGFTVDTSFVRDYNTTYGSQILGYTGMMYDYEVEKYMDLGYDLDAQVGKDGAELAFESYLHGKDGVARVTSTASGVVTNTTYTQETIPGNHIYLTLDIGMQAAAENALNSYIVQENEQREKDNADIDLAGGDEETKIQYITGGSACVVDVKTGEPLAIASWPTYDVAAALEDGVAAAREAANNPMFNRALQGTYAPGSTFKPCTAMAGLLEGKIDTTTTMECEGIYTKYADIGYAPKCWIYGQGLHGTLDLAGAITNSCNFYFYTVGDYLQISLMAKYARLYGLGESTGIEVYEEKGVMTTDQYFQKKYGRDVYAGEAIQAAIGQAESEFTPLQMAEYCAAIANNGYRHTASMLKSVYTYDFSSELYTRFPEVLSRIEAPQEYYDAVHTGMRGVVIDPLAGSAYLYFYDTPYTVAAKTGTAQIGEGRTNNAMFICYAPYEDPEIAISIAVEKGRAGASVIKIARDILDYYFAFKDSTVALETE
ncbi:MAG: hypothetical protein IJ705_07670, partial [Oscillospiraceae bacterium]|nr:hypothetical protein [Oscillospiraceae bacterium]